MRWMSWAYKLLEKELLKDLNFKLSLTSPFFHILYRLVKHICMYCVN